MAEERINHDYTSEPICPHCGRAVRDAWELGESTDEHECGGCERLFSISRHIEVTWCTEEIDEPAPTDDTDDED